MLPLTINLVPCHTLRPKLQRWHSIWEESSFLVISCILTPFSDLIRYREPTLRCRRAPAVDTSLPAASLEHKILSTATCDHIDICDSPVLLRPPQVDFNDATSARQLVDTIDLPHKFMSRLEIWSFCCLLTPIDLSTYCFEIFWDQVLVKDWGSIASILCSCT